MWTINRLERRLFGAMNPATSRALPSGSRSSAMATGPTAIAASVDPVAAAKVVADFAKTNDKLEIVGGSMGSVVLDEAGIRALASMPSLDELRAKLIGLVNAPATKIAQVVTAPAAKVARVFAAYADKAA